MGDTLVLGCNSSTQSSEVEWTMNATHGIVPYYNRVYVNGTIRGHHNVLLQFSVVNTSEGEYSLRIYNVHPTYSGWYNCYETDGTRIIGYYLDITRMLIIIFGSQQLIYLLSSALVLATSFLTVPLPSIRQRLSYDDCLEDKRENYQNCSMLYCVAQLCTVIWTLLWAVLTDELFSD